MAVDMWSSESSSLGMSPRISFSHDLCQSDVVRIEHLNDHRPDTTLLLDPTPDFDFCVSQGFEIESSTADELFSDGKLLPLEIKKQQIASQKPPIAPPNRPIGSENTKKESLKEIMEKSTKTEEKMGSSSRSFWRFTRSSSCGNGYKRSLICSLPLLSRSNSTGSAPKTPLMSQRSSNNRTSSTMVKSSSFSNSSSSNSSNSCYYSSYLQKPPLKKNQHNGIRISPVLNVPPPYLPKGTANLFGLGSLFCNGKDKVKKKG